MTQRGARRKGPPGFEEVTKAAPFAGVDVHPIPGRRRAPIKSRDLPAWGGTDGRESKFVRCKQCGFILDQGKTPRGSGRGNEQAVLKDGSTTVYNAVQVNGGCPFCGSSEY